MAGSLPKFHLLQNHQEKASSASWWEETTLVKWDFFLPVPKTEVTQSQIFFMEPVGTTLGALPLEFKSQELGDNSKSPSSCSKHPKKAQG